MNNLGTLLPRQTLYRPDQLAIVFEDTRLTFRQFGERVNQLSNALQSLGVCKGDKIATVLPNCLEQLDVYWAAAQTGAVVVPLSPLLRRGGLKRLLDDSDSVLVVTDRAFTPYLNEVRGDLAKLHPDRFLVVDGPVDGYVTYQDIVGNSSTSPPKPVEIKGDDPYNIIYSSGTTGLPKGIVHTHRIRAAYCTNFGLRCRFTPESVAAHTGSLVFNGAFLTLMPAMYLGIPFIFTQQFDASKLIELIEFEKITHIWMVPSQVVAMLDAPNFDPARLQSLEMLGSLGAPLLMEHKQAIANALPNRFYELYGLTEGFMTILDPNDFAKKAESVGCPDALSEMRIERSDGSTCDHYEVGQIVGRGPTTMPGYYKRPDLTKETLRDGWLHSGDLGYVDEDGFLYLVDREKDLIISGGVNVYPRDIEEIIARHPAVREVAVFGIPDEQWGETPLAAVILRELDHVSEAELRQWTNKRVEARYQKISSVEFMEDFPRNTAGKTLKRKMRELHWRKHDTQ